MRMHGELRYAYTEKVQGGLPLERTTSGALEALAPLGLPTSPHDLEPETFPRAGVTRALAVTLGVAALHWAALRFIFFTIGAG